MVILLMPGCEHMIDFQGSENGLQGITVNALAVPDTVFTAAISRAYLFTEVPALNYIDYWEYEAHPDPFYEKAVLSEAEVELVVNEQEKYTMRYDPLHYNFTSDYMPRSGDRITLRVKAEDLESVSAETIVPNVQLLEILGCEKYYKKEYIGEGPLSDISQDTVAHITLRLTDPGDERNYYRLKVRSIAHDKRGGSSEVILQYSDIYTSSDVIFMDEQLTRGYGGWVAHFSNIFDDHLFNGKEYTFSVETHLRYGEHPHAVIELQSITRDLYYYLKSVMLYRITDQDAYTEAIQIHSNINSGWGILGGLSAEKHTVYF
ncbi:MAG: DUF4249 domain-containing protein [Petrimonas sp.]|uniref:DUF4249 domain-containing protein n=2 Tax=Petrimonas sp. TaxID=2023866 RepID=UPI00268D3688|nr:DUF4249 domain-containing protein [Petrimonas sp.]